MIINHYLILHFPFWFLLSHYSISERYVKTSFYNYGLISILVLSTFVISFEIFTHTNVKLYFPGELNILSLRTDYLIILFALKHNLSDIKIVTAFFLLTTLADTFLILPLYCHRFNNLYISAKAFVPFTSFVIGDIYTCIYYLNWYFLFILPFLYSFSSHFLTF